MRLFARRGVDAAPGEALDGAVAQAISDALRGGEGAFLQRAPGTREREPFRGCRGLDH